MRVREHASAYSLAAASLWKAGRSARWAAWRAMSSLSVSFWGMILRSYEHFSWNLFLFDASLPPDAIGDYGSANLHPRAERPAFRPRDPRPLLFLLRRLCARVRRCDFVFRARIESAVLGSGSRQDPRGGSRGFKRTRARFLWPRQVETTCGAGARVRSSGRLAMRRADAARRGDGGRSMRGRGPGRC